MTGGLELELGRFADPVDELRFGHGWRSTQSAFHPRGGLPGGEHPGKRQLPDGYEIRAGSATMSRRWRHVNTDETRDVSCFEAIDVYTIWTNISSTFSGAPTNESIRLDRPD